MDDQGLHLPAPAKKDPSAIILPFGKYKGATVAQVVESDLEYVNWILTQGWLPEKFAELHAALLSRGAGTDDTPEHNALQGRFTDPVFCAAFVCAVTDESVLWKRLDDDVSGIGHEWLWRENDGSRQMKEEARTYKDRYEGALAAIAGGDYALSTSVWFEDRGVDVTVVWWWATGREMEWRFRGRTEQVELKPALGDDYPTVMRQMQRLGVRNLVVGRYTGRGVSEQVLRTILESSGIRLIFVDEIESKMMV
jgi:uncharacterized protein (DUF3820 family)